MLSCLELASFPGNEASLEYDAPPERGVCNVQQVKVALLSCAQPLSGRCMAGHKLAYIVTYKPLME